MGQYGSGAVPVIPVLPYVGGGPMTAETPGVWQDGKLLVVHRWAWDALPCRCVKCGTPVAQNQMMARTFAYCSPWVILFFFLGSPLLYIILYLVLRKTAKMRVPVCDFHRNRRMMNMLIGWLVFAAGLAVVVAGPVVLPRAPEMLVIGFVISFIGLVWVGVASQLLRPKRIDEQYVWLKGVSPLYLQMLPLMGAPVAYVAPPGQYYAGFPRPPQ